MSSADIFFNTEACLFDTRFSLSFATSLKNSLASSDLICGTLKHARATSTHVP